MGSGLHGNDMCVFKRIVPKVMCLDGHKKGGGVHSDGLKACIGEMFYISTVKM